MLRDQADYDTTNRRTAERRLLADHRRHTENVHRIFQRLFSDPARSSLVKAAAKLA